MSLESLLSHYRFLKTRSSTAKEKALRGLAFEKLLTALFRLQGIFMTEPFRIVGEQIDGAFEYKGWTYLVEAKWQGAKKSTDALYSFQGKPDRRIEGTRGLFISMSGFYETSVAQFSRGRKPNTLLWSGEHIEAVLQGLITIPELLDCSIRFAAERGELLTSARTLLASRDKSLFEVILEACNAQVDAEIASSVGKKFIPQLYVEREIQEELDRYIQPEKYLNILLHEARKVQPNIPYSREKIKDLKGLQSRQVLSKVLASVRAAKITSFQNNSLLQEFIQNLPVELNGRMHVITARAGTGKTNLLCHLARYHAREHPTVFLTGRSGISERTSIKELVESRLRRYLTSTISGDHLFERILSIVERKGEKLLVYIDAINEHSDLDVLNLALARFLYEIKGYPVIVIVSCRDIYWPFFNTSTWPTTQWSKLNFQFDAFSWSEYEKAITAYFDFYNIKAELSYGAVSKLSHPLILRFFCETYGDPTSPAKRRLPYVSDIRMKELFGDYLSLKLDSLRHTTPRKRRTAHEIEEYLYNLAGQMRKTKTRTVTREAISEITKDKDMESPESVYVAVLAEDILIEEEPNKTNYRANVVFTYDEFMEYMIARSMIASCDTANPAYVEELVKECQFGADEFPSFVGIFEYIVVILREDHELSLWSYVDTSLAAFGVAACRAIRKLNPQFVNKVDIEFSETLLLSPKRALREAAVSFLVQVVGDKVYKKETRVQAVELIKDLLIHEEDIRIRARAIEVLGKPGFNSLSKAARHIASWWAKMNAQVKCKKILITDDESSILQIMEMILKAEEYKNIYTESDDSKVIKLIESVEPDLIITDYNKLHMTGEEMARVLKSNPKFSQIPIILLSAFYEGEPDPALFCLFIQKPFDREDLLSYLPVALTGKLDVG